MAAIAGYINFKRNSANADVLERMTNSMHYRGKGGHDSFIKDYVALGQCLTTPTMNKSSSVYESRYTIVFDGYILNLTDITKELALNNFYISGCSNDEVLIKAFDVWGPEMLIKLNGGFTIAIWDNHDKTLFLARDRYGIKPLYYSFSDNSFFFASEQKAIITHPKFKKNIDTCAIYEYFTFQNIFTDSTFFKDIRLFPAGCYAIISSKPVDSLLTKQYWDFSFCEPETTLHDNEYIEELNRLLRQAVDRQLAYPGNIGSYLSGGMDSGTVVAIAAEKIPYIKTFTCGFDMHSASGLELSYDEREKSEYMSYLFKTEHYEMVLKAGDLQRAMPKIAWHIEEPRVGQSYPNYYIAQLASKFVDAVMCGTGGDELFGGYPWRYYRSIDNNNFDEYIDKYYNFWQRLIPSELAPSAFSPIWNEVRSISTRDIFKGIFNSQNQTLISPTECINHSMYFEAKTFLHGLLVMGEKLSMSHGLETLFPFLDNDLVDFATRLPMRLKLQNHNTILQRIDENEIGSKGETYFKKTGEGKNLLRNTMNRYIPSSITNAEKQGFSAPDGSWFRGESIDYVEGIVYNDDSNIYSFLDKSVVRSVVEEHLTGKANRRLFIWSIISFYEYLKLFGGK